MSELKLRGELEIRNATLEFIDFCMRFNTSCDQDKGGDTKPLSDKLTEYKKILEQQGPFTNPQINHLIDEINGNAINLQRQIGRQTSSKMSDDQRLSIYEERHDLVSRLEEIRKLIKLKFDKLIIEDETTGQRPTEQEKTIFSCEPSTTWKDITITLVADDTVRIKTPQGERRFTYHKLGMEDERIGDKPIVIWELMKLFAKNQGFISSQNPNYDPKLPDTAKRLNKHLKGLFGINETIYTGHYKKEKGYKTKIKFYDHTY